MPNYTLQNGTLKNLLGATEAHELEKIEAGYVAARVIELDAGGGPRATFDAAHLKALHHHLFQDVYEWAGRMHHEAVSLSDGTVATVPTMAKIDRADFSIGPQIGREIDQLMGDLHKANRLRGLNRDEFANKAALDLQKTAKIPLEQWALSRLQRTAASRLRAEEPERPGRGRIAVWQHRGRDQTGYFRLGIFRSGHTRRRENVLDVDPNAPSGAEFSS